MSTDDASVSTRLAIDRTRFACERTLMAWTRTSVSLISFGFTIYKFFELEARTAVKEGVLGPRPFALLMISIGLAALVLATIDHRRNLRALQAAGGAEHYSLSLIVAALVGVLGVLGLVGVLRGA